jgi:septal ring factor EnvC (AmiA/AmiB activator)
MKDKPMRILKFLLNLGLVASLLAVMAGCSALNSRSMRDKELAETRAKLDQTTQLANELSTQVKEQQAEIAELKEHNVEEVPREKEQALAQIEIKRQELEQERYQIDRMRRLQQADVEEEEAPKMSIQPR